MFDQKFVDDNGTVQRLIFLVPNPLVYCPQISNLLVKMMADNTIGIENLDFLTQNLNETRYFKFNPIFEKSENMTYIFNLASF